MIKKARHIVNDAEQFSNGSKVRELADSLLQVAASANFDTFEILKKDDLIIRDALKEGIKPEMDAAADDKAKDVAERMIGKGQLSDADNADHSRLALSQDKDLRGELIAAIMANDFILWQGIHLSSAAFCSKKKLV